jgi:predicted TIM-barrel fold metal-dependent hydrolase
VNSLHRRKFLQGSLAVAATAASGLTTDRVMAQNAPANVPESVLRPGEIVDTNVYLSQWPFSRSPYDDPAVLADKLRSHGVVQAWAGSYEGLFHKDITGVNQRLAELCRAQGDNLFVPFGTVNPKLPCWQEDLRRCAEDFKMPGIRVHPGYQHYTLDDPDFAELLRRAAAHQLIVQVVCWMEDERRHNPQMIVPTVDASPLPDLVADIAGLHVVMLNTFLNPEASIFGKLAKVDRISMDIALIELIAGLGVLLERVALDRIMFGSYMPCFYLEANLLKFAESNIPERQARAIRYENARRLLS